MPANKRELVLSVIDNNTPPAYVPAAFFLHFDPSCHRGQAAVDKHLEFFRFTGMDFVKVQYERAFPRVESIRKPEDWAKVPHLELDFFEPQLEVVGGLVQAASAEALVVVTLYSPFMCAGHMAGGDALAAHIRQDPDAVKKGMEIVTDSLMLFARECIRLGVDGFYHSTQGGEAGRFEYPELFQKCVKPYDLAVMEEINRRCQFNILHICDYHLPYADLSPFLEYPGDVVNCNPQLVDRTLAPAEISQMFGRPFMGGMERKGTIARGTEQQVREEARALLAAAPDRFILGADCTVPGDTPWQNLRAAIAEAHGAR